MSEEIEDLKELLDYDPDTGKFTWKVRRGGIITKGSPAGTVRRNDSNAYISILIDGKGYQAHRLAYYYMEGHWPKGDLDHINGNGLDNRWINLRVVTSSENSRNKKIRTDNSSGIQGVYWHKQICRWIARIRNAGKTIHLLTTQDFFLACCARKSAENKYGYHPNHGRLTNAATSTGE